MSKHTPGPWNTRKHGVIVGGPFHQFDGGKAQRQIAMACVISESDGAEDERDANARLIAAAPDMYEALKATLRELTACANQLAALGYASREGGSVHSAQQEARAALAKASDQ